MAPGRKRKIEKTLERQLDDNSDRREIGLEQELINMNPNRLRLEAIFYPKFENEKSDHEIRQEMKDRVSGGQGYIEASLKHSGSLVLWSGGRRYYSKNSTCNKFTAVGEILLRQHFVRAFWTEHERDEMLPNHSLEARYHECSDFIEMNRITLAFEVVTAVLGDHGARPKRDFLILTAVADRQRERFYSTTELLAFAQRFRLPHNDSWVCSTSDSVDNLFRVYDACRETGLAPEIIRALNGVADCRIASVYPHYEFQGDIVEGLVVRYVRYNGQGELNKLAELATVAKALEEIIPVSLQQCHNLVEHLKTDIPSTLTADIRQVYTSTEGFKGPNVEAFTDRLHTILDENGAWRRVRRLGQDSRNLLLNLCCNLTATSEAETKRIAKTLQGISKLKERVEYHVIREENDDGSARWLCVIHVLHDKTFRKYNNIAKEPDRMELFRGFFFEISFEQGLTGAPDRMEIDDTVSHKDISFDFPLMMKLKFLPYMVRTFCCRNGLSRINTGGPNSFMHYVSSLFSKWQISAQQREHWIPFLHGWALYVGTCSNQSETLEPLSDYNYLDYLESYTRLRATGQLTEFQQLKTKSMLKGVIVVVAAHATFAESVANFIAEKVGGAKRVDGIQNLTAELMAMSCNLQEGFVATIELKGLGALKRHCRSSDVLMTILIVDMPAECMTRYVPATEQKQVTGLMSSWRKLNCNGNMTIKIVNTLIGEEGITTSALSSNAKLMELIEDNLSKSASTVDNRRSGILVFFPGIPGCGKSTLSNCDVETLIRRKLTTINNGDGPLDCFVKVGDEIKGKYWPSLSEELKRNPGGVYITDKNTPSSAWRTVASICRETKYLAVPVFPDAGALTTTTISGTRDLHGTLTDGIQHVYPFSLSYLALCMSRVLGRPPNSHSGRLDGGTQRPCMIVVKFFSFYRRKTSDTIANEISDVFRRAGAVCVDPVVVPFFKSQAVSQITKELEDLLVEAVQYQFGLDLNKAKPKDETSYVDGLDGRLKASIQKYSSDLVKLGAEQALSQEAFILAVLTRVIQKEQSHSSKLIKIASVDVDVHMVHDLLCGVEDCKEWDGFKAMICGDRQLSEVLKGRDSTPPFVLQTHVTLAHFTEMSQSEMEKEFGLLRGATVRVTARSVLWSSRVAAIEVELNSVTNDGRTMRRSLNSFQHITVWVSEGASAKDSNQLPELVSQGEAHRINLERRISFPGTVSLWEM